jgi:hypothetical protein
LLTWASRFRVSWVVAAAGVDLLLLSHSSPVIGPTLEIVNIKFPEVQKCSYRRLPNPVTANGLSGDGKRLRQSLWKWNRPSSCSHPRRQPLPSSPRHDLLFVERLVIAGVQEHFGGGAFRSRLISRVLSKNYQNPGNMLPIGCQ